jgi:Fe-S cluster assembly protein SufB
MVARLARAHMHAPLQVETGSAITWKYPSVVLAGEGSVGEFYSVALTNNKQQADTGTKMIHVGRNTRSRIVSKGISAGASRNCYRGLVQVRHHHERIAGTRARFAVHGHVFPSCPQVLPSAKGARNFSQCDSMLIGDRAGANTYPYIQVTRAQGRCTWTPLGALMSGIRSLVWCARSWQVREPSAVVEHEASTSKIGEDQLFYFQQRGVEPEKAVAAIISGFCREVRGRSALVTSVAGP